MEKMFCLGLAFGMVGGALIVANNYKARALVKKGQQEVLDKMDELLDEKLKAAQEKNESSIEKHE
ncbi:MAG: hypothetical protein J6Z36_04090 [Clostridia bacterium]|nr:hypothetical protein [Clostridia bacterium]